MESGAEKIREILNNFHKKLFGLKERKENKLNEFKRKLEEKKIEEIKNNMFKQYEK